LYSQIVKNDGDQLTYYNSGIGTYAKPSWRSLNHWKKVLYNKIDLAIAWYDNLLLASFELNVVLQRNFEKIVIGAYRWLADNYQDGDRIYLFGMANKTDCFVIFID
jgi:uncharacterized protein (DUF2235 family)